MPLPFFITQYLYLVAKLSSIQTIVSRVLVIKYTPIITMFKNKAALCESCGSFAYR